MRLLRISLISRDLSNRYIIAFPIKKSVIGQLRGTGEMTRS